MKLLFAAAAAALLLPLATAHAATDDPQPIECGNCANWNQPHAPFRVFGNTYYVGTAGLSSVLVTGPEGHVLIDGALPQSAPQIARNIAALGFRIEDVRLILNSHPHFDHAGGIAWLQKKSGARVAASRAAVRVLEAGENPADDPQIGNLKEISMPKIPRVHGVPDGETLKVGPLRITAVLTPGHAPGGATWRWRSCETLDGKESCHDVVFADSLSAVSDEDFRFTGDAHHPDRVPAFRAVIAKVAALPCDIVIPAHPDFADVLEKADARKEGGPNPFIVPGACRAYADAAAQRLNARVDKERSQH